MKSQDPYILILYYSQYGATAQLAQYIARGIARCAGLEARIRTVPPVSPAIEASLAAIPEEGAPYVVPEDFEHCIGLALGSPSYFGNMAAPLKYFLDNTGAQWLSGALIGKPACVFATSGSLHGGQESTLLSMMIPLLHHGMVMVGLPYSESLLNTTQSGGTPYGPTHVATTKKGALTSDEIQLARSMGARLGHIALGLQAAGWQ